MRTAESALWVVLAVLAALLVFPAAGASADRETPVGEIALAQSRDIPPTVWFQGFLADQSSGDPVDATYPIVARLYSLPSGGALIWGPETHNDVEIADGWFSIELGATLPLPNFADPPYYLDLVIDGESMSPRQKLGSVPAAFRASAADQEDADWTIAGNDIWHGSGNVGIGAASSGARLEISATAQQAFRASSTGSGGVFTVEGVNTVGTAGAFASGGEPPGYPSTPAALYTAGQNGANGVFSTAYGTGTGIVAQSHDTGTALEGWAYGTGRAGYFHGGSGVEVDGLTETQSFRMPTSASPMYALTSDGSGNGTWQPQHYVSYHNEGATTAIGTQVTQYDDSQITVQAGGTGYIVLQATVMLLLNHTSRDYGWVGISTSPDSWDGGVAYSIGAYDIPSSWPAASQVFRSMTVHRTFVVASSGPYTFHLVGQVVDGDDSQDYFYWAHMTGIYYPYPIIVGETPEANEDDAMIARKMEAMRTGGE
jgi:hypothetical protein